MSKSNGFLVSATAVVFFLAGSFWEVAHLTWKQTAPAPVETPTPPPTTPWELHAVDGDYGNFAWRINVETGETIGLRFQRSDEDGWTIDAVDFTCAGQAGDRLNRGVTTTDDYLKALQVCVELQKAINR